ncbi:pre-mRNA-processing factor 40 A-like [Sarcoptes scabiei]|nr:pre-mRNA-processing factor 40 A-like [Sarcoptes scabiei]
MIDQALNIMNQMNTQRPSTREQSNCSLSIIFLLRSIKLCSIKIICIERAITRRKKNPSNSENILEENFFFQFFEFYAFRIVSLYWVIVIQLIDIISFHWKMTKIIKNLLHSIKLIRAKLSLNLSASSSKTNVFLFDRKQIGVEIYDMTKNFTKFC